MEAEKTMTPKEAIQLLERMWFELDSNNQPERRKALEMAIEAMKELEDICKRCMDDGK